MALREEIIVSFRSAKKMEYGQGKNAASENPVNMVLLTGRDVEEKRREILAYFHDTFSLYESIFECLASEKAYYLRPNALRHPLIFYYGHTSTFFINKMNVAKLIDQRVDPELESMVAIGVDEMSWDDLDESHYDWPRVAAVKKHRDETREVIDHYIKTCEFTLPIKWNDPMWVIMMGIEHERIHLETTSVLIRELPLDMVKSHPVWSNICRDSGEAPENELLPVEGGTVVLGKEKSDPLYGWDNEYGRFETHIEPFRASKYLVSNKEFLDFVEAGGYGTRKYWTAEGWQWVKYKKASHPVYWILQGEAYRYRTMLAVIDMPWDWPVNINYLESKAFCNWKSEKTGKHIRMPSEAEWMKLRQLVQSDLPDWEKAPGNINLEAHTSACPVTQHAFKGGVL